VYLPISRDEGFVQVNVAEIGGLDALFDGLLGRFVAHARLGNLARVENLRPVKARLADSCAALLLVSVDLRAVDLEQFVQYIAYQAK
jgi:hypothetical protein